MGKANIVRQAPDLASIQTMKIDEVNAAVAAAILAGFQAKTIIASTGKAHYYSTDDHDQRNFMGKFSMILSDSTIREVYWKTEDTGNFVVHTRDEFIAICKEVNDHIEGKIQSGVLVKANVAAATTVEDVMKLKWEG